MNLQLKVLLIAVSLLVIVYVLRKIRKSQLQIQYAIKWILGSIVLLVMSVFDGVIFRLSQALGFVSPSNFVLVVVLFFLLWIVFYQDIKISTLDEKLKNLNHHVALKESEENSDKE